MRPNGARFRVCGDAFGAPRGDRERRGGCCFGVCLGLGERDVLATGGGGGATIGGRGGTCSFRCIFGETFAGVTVYC
jgi:hypothetical protein